MTYVLIPGAGGSADHWHLLVDELRRRGRDTVAVDLPAADDTAALPEYADTVRAAIGERRQVVLVAHSLGAFTAPLLADDPRVTMIVVLPGGHLIARSQPRRLADQLDTYRAHAQPAGA